MSKYSAINPLETQNAVDPVDPPPTIDLHTAALLAEIFRALSDPSRIRIVSAMAEGEMERRRAGGGGGHQRVGGFPSPARTSLDAPGASS